AIFTIHTLRPFFELKNILLVVVLATIFSIIYAFMTNGSEWMVGAMLPWAFVCGYSIFRYMWKYRTKKLLPMLRTWGPYTAHLGIMLILIGYCLSYGLGTENSITLQEGERKLAGDFILELEEVTMNSGPDMMACVPKCTAFIILVENDDNVLIDDQITKQTDAGQETTQIYLKHQIHRDLYITLNKVTQDVDGEQSATITVREIPGIILVWIGSFLTILGMIMTMFTEWKPGQKWLKSISKKVPDH
ncbi:MAG TPA: cytochrome c-type biogenesis CcmF C-terminal domain-containing protein, partial [Candidatus Poseidoniia archaeon]|nr:cytochrome c-type biogenesis CcmF C-terminal domain-containing protein [Candidatus Poseidoniia archaeon]